MEREVTENFSQDPQVMNVLLNEPKLCTLHELQTIYSLDDFYDFVEIIEVQKAFREESERKQEAENQRNNKR